MTPTARGSEPATWRATSLVSGGYHREELTPGARHGRRGRTDRTPSWPTYQYEPSAGPGAAAAPAARARPPSGWVTRTTRASDSLDVTASELAAAAGGTVTVTAAAESLHCDWLWRAGPTRI